MFSTSKHFNSEGEPDFLERLAWRILEIQSEVEKGVARRYCGGSTTKGVSFVAILSSGKYLLNVVGDW